MPSPEGKLTKIVRGQRGSSGIVFAVDMGPDSSSASFAKSACIGGRNLGESPTQTDDVVRTVRCSPYGTTCAGARDRQIENRLFHRSDEGRALAKGHGFLRGTRQTVRSASNLRRRRRRR